MVDIALIVFAVIVPILLIAFNLIILARYIDPQAAAGHFLAKLMIVSGTVGGGETGRVGGLLAGGHSCSPDRYDAKHPRCDGNG